MECGGSWEYKTLINELTQGMEQTRQLRAYLSSTYSETQDLLVQRILSSYEKALLILRWSGSVAQSHVMPPASGAPESSISVDGSSRSDELNRNFKDHQEVRDVTKKRKLMPTWTEQVKVNPENGLEGPTDDGYSWRKYGQKDILGAKYPRSYYRCTYRLVQNCWATKQVQRSDDEPTIFEITYKGTHTCNQATALVPSPASPEKQESKTGNHQNDHDLLQPNQMLMNLRANLRVHVDNSENQETISPFSFPQTFAYKPVENQNYLIPYGGDNSSLPYSPSFVSPARSESHYFPISSHETNSFGGVHNLYHSESDLTEIFSTNTSATNSPAVGLEFTADLASLDANFPFDIPGFPI